MQSSKHTASSLAHLEVRHSSVHGHGVFAASDLPSGTLVGEYAGRRYSAREACAAVWDNRLIYLFGLSDGTLIDGTQGGNATRHLNHSCEPNCEAVEEHADNGLLTVRIKTIKAVSVGEELFLDYALEIDAEDSPADYPCCCGFMRCRGTLVALVEPRRETHRATRSRVRLARAEPPRSRVSARVFPSRPKNKGSSSR